MPTDIDLVRINMPPILLYQLNKIMRFPALHSKILEFWNTGWSSFEDVCTNLVLLRFKSFRALLRTTCSLSELFPGAAYSEDVANRIIKIPSCEFVEELQYYLDFSGDNIAPESISLDSLNEHVLKNGGVIKCADRQCLFDLCVFCPSKNIDESTSLLGQCKFRERNDFKTGLAANNKLSKPLLTKLESFSKLSTIPGKTICIIFTTKEPRPILINSILTDCIVIHANNFKDCMGSYFGQLVDLHV